MASLTHERTVLTIKENCLALQNLENASSKKSIAEKYGIPPDFLIYWIKNKDNIIEGYESGQFRAKRQKLSRGMHERVEKAIANGL